VNRGTESERGPARFRVALRCDLLELRPQVDRVRKFLLQAGLAEKEALECELVLVEACTNAIQNVSPERRQNPVTVDVTVEERQVEFRVTDHTPGFPWPKRSALPDANSERGRGIFLIQSLMTSTDYVRGEDGNMLVLRRRL